ncbi:MAG: hypothetical protein DHS20C14_07890 [Phycisphaeraceae bacterium]|nr:MAG: hypothetical protein DHS20C14_07890 [Phycisphaeraceae bacterium]
MPTRDDQRANRFLSALRDPRMVAALAGTAIAVGLAGGCETTDTAGKDRYRPYKGTGGDARPAEPEVNAGLASLSAKKPTPTLIAGEAPAPADERQAAQVAESARLLDEYFSKSASTPATPPQAVASRQTTNPSGYDPSAELGPTGSSQYAPVQVASTTPPATTISDPALNAVASNTGSPNAGLSSLGDQETSTPESVVAARSPAPASSGAITIEDMPGSSAGTSPETMSPVRVVDRSSTPPATTQNAAPITVHDTNSDPALSAVTSSRPTTTPVRTAPTGTLQGRPVEANTTLASADGSMPRMAPRSPEDRKNELVDELVAVLGEIADNSDEPYRMGLALAGLETLSPGALYELTESGVLMPDEVRTLLAAHEFLSGLSAGGGMPDAGHVSDLLGEVKEKLDEHAPLKIAAAELCTRVLGYGQYDMFPKAPDGSYQFVSGRRQPVIVYVEVDRFGRRPLVGDDGLARWEVTLSQTLEIFHDADDLLVMGRGAETDRSVSRNKIRDYYLINQTYLPENLSVGKYNLKVVMRDENKQAVAEAIVPFSIVPSAPGFSGRQ